MDAGRSDTSLADIFKGVEDGIEPVHTNGKQAVDTGRTECNISPDMHLTSHQATGQTPSPFLQRPYMIQNVRIKIQLTTYPGPKGTWNHDKESYKAVSNRQRKEESVSWIVAETFLG